MTDLTADQIAELRRKAVQAAGDRSGPFPNLGCNFISISTDNILSLCAMAERAIAPSGGEKVRPVPELEGWRPAGSKHEFLLICSYCGGDTPGCTDETPCNECLRMCNIYGEDGKFIRTLPPAPPDDDLRARLKEAEKRQAYAAAVLGITYRSFDAGGESARSQRAQALEAALFNCLQDDTPFAEELRERAKADPWAFIREAKYAFDDAARAFLQSGETGGEDV